MSYTLFTIDVVVTVAAMLLVSVACARWLLRSRRDPLLGSPHRPNTLREDGLALAILVYFVAIVASQGMAGFFTDDDESILARLIVNTGAQSGGIAICLFIGATRFRGGMRGFFLGSEATHRKVTLAAGVTIISVSFCPIVAEGSASVIQYFAPNYVLKAHPTLEALHDSTQPVGVVVMFWVGALVLAPVLEELFFRGLIQTYLGGILPNRWAAIGIASIAFGFVHSFQPQAVIALIVLAALMGYAYERSGSLVVPIAIHALFNLKTLVWDAVGSV